MTSPKLTRPVGRGRSAETMCQRPVDGAAPAFSGTLLALWQEACLSCTCSASVLGLACSSQSPCTDDGGFGGVRVSFQSTQSNHILHWVAPQPVGGVSVKVIDCYMAHIPHSSVISISSTHQTSHRCPPLKQLIMFITESVIIHNLYKYLIRVLT